MAALPSSLLAAPERTFRWIAAARCCAGHCTDRGRRCRMRPGSDGEL